MARQMTATSPPGRCAMSWGVNLEIGIQDSEIYWKPSSVKCHVNPCEQWRYTHARQESNPVTRKIPDRPLSHGTLERGDDVSEAEAPKRIRDK